MSNTSHITTGFDQSDVETATIADLGTTHTPINLARQYAFIRISIADFSNVPADTTLSFQGHHANTGTLYNLWDLNGQALLTTGTLPTGATPVSFLIRDAVGVRRIALVLSNALSGGTLVATVQGIIGGKGIT